MLSDKKNRSPEGNLPINGKPEQFLQILRDLRPIFLGLCNRHDPISCNITIGEQGSFFERELNKSNFYSHKTIHSIRDPFLEPISIAQFKRIKETNPSVEFVSEYPDNPALAHRGVFGHLSMEGANPDSHNILSYFENYARDAGFALAGLLLSRTLNFDLPSLVPYSFFKKLYETEGSIQLPSQLENRWILFLFALGWQCFTNNPIRASKEIDVDGCTYEAYDIDKVYNTYCGVLPKEKLEKIPKNIRCFNSKLKQDICLASVYAIDYLIDNKNDSQCFDSLISQLDNLPIGKKNASEYEALIASILFALFNPHLKNIERKTKENQGRGVVDITADNKAERGFFREIKDRYGIHSPIIFVECKNISYDFANDEANQIASRLGERQGLFGILACRSINNKNVALSRCKDILENDHKYVIVLEDSDFIKLLEKRKINDLNGIWEHLESKLKQIVLKQ